MLLGLFQWWNSCLIVDHVMAFINASKQYDYERSFLHAFTMEEIVTQNLELFIHDIQESYEKNYW